MEIIRLFLIDLSHEDDAVGKRLAGMITGCLIGSARQRGGRGRGRGRERGRGRRGRGRGRRGRRGLRGGRAVRRGGRALRLRRAAHERHHHATAPYGHLLSFLL